MKRFIDREKKERGKKEGGSCLVTIAMVTALVAMIQGECFTDATSSVRL